MKGKVVLIVVLAAVMLAGAAGLVRASQHAIDTVRVPSAPAGDPAGDPAAIARGAKLAAVGDCMACHTVEGGKPFAGGLPLETPFGHTIGRQRDNHGAGFAFAHYKNLMTYFAIAMELTVERDTGQVHIQRAVAAVDCGQIVNPAGVRNQIEGGILQTISWTLYEQTTFDTRRITSYDWSTYPIMRFSSVPEHVEVHLINRPGLPFLGVGEAAQGPAAAVIANATGVRLRDLPLAGAKLRAALPA